MNINFKKEARKLASEYNIPIQDMENILRSMYIEDVDPTEENIQEYYNNFDRRAINIKVSKNTQRILNNLKEGRETYEDVILRKITGDE